LSLDLLDHVLLSIVIVAHVWLLANHKWQDSLKFKGSYSFLSQGIANFWFLTFHQNFSKSISETEGCAKMNIKAEKEREMKKEVQFWKYGQKSAGQVKLGGTGFRKPVAPVSVDNKRIRPVTHPTQSPFIPIYPPRPKTVNGEARGAIPWRFEGSTVGFKEWGKNLVLQSSGIEFPSVSWLQQHSHHVRR
jgi:hypothetical protein